MNLAAAAIQRKTISWMMVVLLGLGGLLSFSSLGRLEFPEFTINQALVITAYPGASPEQVEEEVSVQLEDAIQQLPDLDYVSSINSAGLSQITVTMRDSLRSAEYTQVWDELRRKIADAQSGLPPGAFESHVLDDFGDVYGIYVSLTGSGYSYADIREYAKSLRRELVLVDGVKKVSIDGEQEEQLFVEISRERLSSLGVSLATVQSLLTDQNVVSNAGSIRANGQAIRVNPTGEFSSVTELSSLVVSPPGSSRLIYLGDIAEISRGYASTPRKLYRTEGQPALTLGISFQSNVNVVTVAEAVRVRMAELESERPIGIDVHTIYDQGEVVDASISDFLVTLAQAVGIVFVILLIFMGLRSGALMGLILLLTIFGTFIVMAYMDINLHVISLGALIIALGMLVDNAIVVTEGMLMNVNRGMSKIEAAKKVVTQNQWPLLGATAISVTAFAPIGLSSGSSGEFAGSLFWVLFIALSISWITAMTLTPMFFNLFFKAKAETTETVEPYRGIIFTIYRGILRFCLKYRILTMIATFAILVGSVIAFGNVKNNFFPPSTTPIYLVDYFLPEGVDIRETERAAEEVEAELERFPEIQQITTVIGGGAQRFVLPYAPEDQYASYAQFIVTVGSSDELDPMILKTAQWMQENHPEADTRVRAMSNGPAAKASLEARFFGEDPEVLRSLAAQATAIIEADPGAYAVRSNWRNRVNSVRPQFAPDAARRAGITKANLEEAIQTVFEGRQIGVFREGTDLLPIVLRAPEAERLRVDSLRDLQIWSPEYASYVPISQVVSGFEVEPEDPFIVRRDRKRVISVYAEPLLFNGDTASSILGRVRADIEAIALPEGYTMNWGGEYEESSKASGAIFGTLPLGILFMFIITVVLFNNIREPIIVWLTVPLALVGVAIGLLATGQPFGFMALLGFLSLIGMLLKNSIVLVEQIRLEKAEEKAPYEAIFDASVSRVRPVMMAALTTMLGMIPLMFNGFFASMAVVIIFGLGAASLITLIVLPVIYALVFGVKAPKPAQ